ncbi:hypothetical protein CR513_25619, partial [Mucuna pruriens]
MLPYALHEYRTSIRTSTGATLYSLVYDTKAMLLLVVEIPFSKVLAEVKLSDAEWLNFVEEKQLTTLCHGQLYQKRIKSTFDKKVRPQVFKEGDLVLRKILPNTRYQQGKWDPNYEGPYMVKHAFSRGALMLVDSRGASPHARPLTP